MVYECPIRSLQFRNGWFSFGREEGNPTHYSDQHSPAHVDVLTSGLILAFVIIAICFYVITPAFNSSRRWSLFWQITFSLFIGGIIILGNFGHEWEVGSIKMKSPYKAGSASEMVGDLKLHIALRGINITLKGKAASRYFEDLVHEKIDYNEHFSWEWAQGRFGFGIYANRLSREFRAAVYRGLPLPILQVAEYFTFDGEGLRFGRHYRLAGWYSHIILWTCFPMWIITNFLFCVQARSGASLLTLTGIFQLIACGIWFFLRNPIELSVPFESNEMLANGHAKEEIILKTKFGIDFYLVFGNGILCIVVGLTILLLDNFIPDEISVFFGIDPLTNFEQYLPSLEECKKEEEEAQTKDRRGFDAFEKGYFGDESKFKSNQDEDTQSPKENSVVLKRRPSVLRSKFGSKVQKSVRRNSHNNKPIASPRNNQIKTDIAIYSKPSSTVKFSEENEIPEENENPTKPLLRKTKKSYRARNEHNQNDGPVYDNIP